MDVEAESDGIVRHIEPAGKTLEPGDVVGWLYALDETIPDVLPQAERKTDLEPTEVGDESEESGSGSTEKNRNPLLRSTNLQVNHNEKSRSYLLQDD